MTEVEQITQELAELRVRLLLAVVRERPAGMTPPDAAELLALIANGDQEFGKRGFRVLVDDLLADERLALAPGHTPTGRRTRVLLLPDALT